MRVFLTIFILVVVGYLAYQRIDGTYTSRHNDLRVHVSQQIAEHNQRLSKSVDERTSRIENKIDRMEQRTADLGLMLAMLIDQAATATTDGDSRQLEDPVDRTLTALAAEQEERKVTPDERNDLKPQPGETAEDYNARAAPIVRRKVGQSAEGVRERAQRSGNPETQQALTAVADCMQASAVAMEPTTNGHGFRQLGSSATDCYQKVRSTQQRLDRLIEENRREHQQLECATQPLPEDRARCDQLDQEYKELLLDKKEVDHAAMMMKMFMMWLAVVLILSGNVAVGLFLLQMAMQESGGDQPTPPPPCCGPDFNDDPDDSRPTGGTVRGPGGEARLDPRDDGLYVDYGGELGRVFLFAWQLPSQPSGGHFQTLGTTSFRDAECDSVDYDQLFCRNLRGPSVINFGRISFSDRRITSAEILDCTRYREGISEAKFDCP